MLGVSIIVPVYNKEKYLKQSIESVLNQTYPNYELILINDGSTDNSKDVILNYCEKDKRIKYIEQDNKGVSFARNIGIQNSNNNYICFFDADDKLSPFFLEKMVQKIKETNANVCYCGHYEVSDEKMTKGKIKFYEGDILDKYIYNICTPHTNSWIFNKSFLNENNLKFDTDLNWGEDMLFFSEVLLHEKNIKCVKEYLTHYQIGIPDSLSINSLNKIDKDIIWMEKLKIYINKVEKNSRRRKKILKAIDSYRLPGAIIYRLYNNKETVSKKELSDSIFFYESYIEKVKFSNGLRSLKLIYYKNKVKSLKEK